MMLPQIVLVLCALMAADDSGKAKFVVGDRVLTTRDTSLFVHGVEDRPVSLGEEFPVLQITEEYVCVRDGYRQGWIKIEDLVNRRDAVKHFTEAIEVAPSDKPLRLARAKVAHATKQFPLAESDFSELIRLDPENWELFINRAQTRDALGKFHEAMADCDEAVRIANDDKKPEAYYARASFWHRRQDLDKALADLEKALEHSQNDFTRAYVLCGRGDAWLEKRDYDKAFADYDEAIRLAPQLNPYPYRFRAAAWIRRKKWPDAISDLSAALVIESGLTSARVARGILQARQGNMDQAEQDLAEAVKSDPSDEYAISEYARFKALRGNRDEAIKDLHAALKLDPTSIPLLFRLASVLEAGEQFGEERDSLRKAVELEPFNDQAHNGLAWFYATCPDEKYRDGKAAVEHATKSCELNYWKRPATIDTLAAAYAEAGDFDKAIEYQQKAIDMESKNNGSTLTGAQKRLELFKQKKAFREDPKRSLDLTNDNE